MKDVGVKFVGNPEDHTGYGRAGLYMLEALYSAGVPVVLSGVNFIANSQGLPTHIAAMQSAKVDYKSVIIELTPDHFPIYREPGKRNIGYFFWEADRIPREWVRCCNLMDEIWVPCRSNAAACAKSGVGAKIVIVPQPTPKPLSDKKIWVPGVDSETYIFYSIFQWTERKNPKCLIDAYLDAFHGNENVMLIVKSYLAGDSAKEVKIIRDSILSRKRAASKTYGVDNSALGRVFFASKILSDDGIDRLQHSGHCFVTAARGEGWNIPAAIAIMIGQPVISPSYGGVVDMLALGDYYSVPNDKMIPVSGMPWIEWYESNQNWCDPSRPAIAKHMRTVFDEKIKQVSYGDLPERISIKGVGEIVRDRLAKA